MRIEAYLSFFERLENNPLVLSSIDMLLAALEEGHVCLTLDHLAQKMEMMSHELEAILFQSALVGKAGDFRPLIIDQSRLYLARFWFEEAQVAQYLRQKMQAISTVEIVQAKATLDKLFPHSVHEPDWQKLAVALAMIQPLTIISGGPGTGKTTTLIKILVAILAQEKTKDLQSQPLIKLAAPTGKAAARMQNAIREAKSRLPVDFAALLPHIPDEASTLHRLLRINPLSRNQNTSPLSLDILVIDEASMIDLSMMHDILRCLPIDARLILLGDQDQLASVEPGAVFASISVNQGYTSLMTTQLDQLTGIKLPLAEPVAYLSDAVVHLQHSYRFSAQSGIGALALAAKNGDIDQAEIVLKGKYSDINWNTDKTLAYQMMREGYRPYIEAVRDLTIPMTTVFAIWDQFRILTPLREGPEGSIALNQKLSRAYEEVGHTGEWYTGQAIMITENHPSQGLYNGDIGLTRVIEGKVYVYFLDEEKGVRSFTPARLPTFESAFVMTVHKSQGSEFDHVYCYLPDVVAPMMSKALFYTAVTRAKKQVTICGKMEVIETMLAQSEMRESGLAERLHLSTN